ncbi:MAG TPA: hypothetical protein VGR26_09440, partial [Acidimicrobiales bacterium]|nr:hypothetical protein [Acidimicrobiales bacterium]
GAPARLAAALVAQPTATEQAHVAREQARQAEAAAKERQRQEVEERCRQEAVRRRESLNSRYGVQAELYEVLSGLSDAELDMAWSAVMSLDEVLIEAACPLLAWAVETPEPGLLLACTSGLLFCPNGSPLEAELWTPRTIVGHQHAAGAVVLELDFGDVVAVEVRPVEDEADILAEVISLIVSYRSRRKLVRAFDAWLAE